MKAYTVYQTHEYIDSFDESDIPKGMTAEEYAEQRYCEGYGNLDGHSIEVVS